MCAMACIAHVGTRNVSVDRPTPSELGDTTTSIQQKKIPAARKSPSASHESENGKGCYQVEDVI